MTTDPRPTRTRCRPARPRRRPRAATTPHHEGTGPFRALGRAAARPLPEPHARPDEAPPTRSHQARARNEGHRTQAKDRQGPPARPHRAGRGRRATAGPPRPRPPGHPPPGPTHPSWSDDRPPRPRRAARIDRPQPSPSTRSSQSHARTGTRTTPADPDPAAVRMGRGTAELSERSELPRARGRETPRHRPASNRPSKRVAPDRSKPPLKP